MDPRLYTLLMNLRESPGMYIGRKSLEKLATFVYGYIQCMFERDHVNPVFLQEFQEFVENYYGLQGNPKVFRHWSDIISFFKWSEEDAFDEFYKLVDLYLANS